MYTPIHLLASELGLPMYCLLLAMRAMSRCDSGSTLLHIEKIATFQTLKNKINELADVVDFCKFPSLSLESLYVAKSVETPLHYVCYLYQENKSGSSMN